MKRLAALVAAVAMVAGAALVRNAWDDGGGSGGSGDGDGGGDASLLLRCSSTLAAACERLDAQLDDLRVVVADDGDTARELTEADPEDVAFDGWLTTSSWPATVAQDREIAGEPRVLGRSSARLGRSPAVIVAEQDRARTLAAACGGSVTWACIGDRAGDPWSSLGGQPTWGTLKPGLPSPERADGTVVLAQAAASRLGRTDYASNDFDDDVGFRPWFDRLVGAAKDARTAAPVPGASPLEQFLVAPAAYGAVGALEAQAGPAVARAARGDLSVLYPEPVVTGDVVLAPPVGTSAGTTLERLGRDRVLDVLARTGWRVAGRDPAPGVGGGPPLPRTDELPGPGVLSALRAEWEAVP